MEAVERARPVFRTVLWTLPILLLLLTPRDALSQTTGSIVGRVVEKSTGTALEGAQLEVVGTAIRGSTSADGRFILGSVPPGERTLRITLIGFKTLELTGIVVRTGRPQDVRIELETAPVVIEGVTVEAERRRLVEPDVSTTHDIVIARELRELPVDRLAQVVELTPGVSGGHFRGGRIGQEVHVVDGVELKNQFEASSSQGGGIELSPTSLEEVEVITGGFGAQYGSALSGVVSYVTRRGNSDRWEGRASLLTDQWAPESMFYGFTALSASAGGPLRFLGGGSTLFVDVLAQGMLDSDPRARGLSCVRADDAGGELASAITALQSTAPELACPLEHSMLPHQRGDKLIAFARYDRNLFGGISFNATALRNRLQRELYTPEFRYSANGQLGQRTTGSLVSANLNWSRNAMERAIIVSARASFMRLDRYLGAVHPSTFDGSRIGGFGMGDFVFHGEEEARAPIEEQLAAPQALPGYAAPGGASGSPFGLAGEGIFFTEGTPHIASWAKTDLLSLDLTNELIWVNGSSLRSGLVAKLYGIESYERTLSHLAGSAPNYARFYPATMSGFGETRIAVSDEMTINVGMRVDAFKSGIDFRADRSDFLSPVIDSKWNMSLNPRFGVAMPVPGTNNGAALRFNYGYVSQPPDFRYFLDTAVGDSLRTDIRRQGNPAMSFERGKSYEVGVSTLLSENSGVSLTIFRKELQNLVSGSLRIGENGDPLYSTDDEGTVNGAELSARGRWADFSLRVSYALQKATGVASGIDSDTIVNPDDTFVQYPLAFDRRHSIDVAAFYGRAAGDLENPLSASLTGSFQSGYPIDPVAAARGDASLGDGYLPWTNTIDLRVSRELGTMPVCNCAWRITGDARNLLGSENVIALRRDTGLLTPTIGAVRALADAMPVPGEIPAESPSYSPAVDLDSNGIITTEEFRNARFAAALSRFDPSLYFSEPRQVRLGIEVTF